MIHDVKIKVLTVHKDIPDNDSGDELGFLMEVLRDDDDLLERFGQTTFTVTPKGTIKAFHWHKHQDDHWFVAAGRARIVLHDVRKDSPTYGVTQVLHAGTDDYKVVSIPRGVAHGFHVISEEPVLLFYHTNKSYQPSDPDEERIPHDHPDINFDWHGYRE